MVTACSASQASVFGIILNSSFSYNPHPIHQQILGPLCRSLPSKASCFHCLPVGAGHLAHATVINEGDYCSRLTVWSLVSRARASLQPERLLQVGGTYSLNSPVTSLVTWNKSRSLWPTMPAKMPPPETHPLLLSLIQPQPRCLFASPKTHQAFASPGQWRCLPPGTPFSQLSVWFIHLSLFTPELSIIGSPAPTLSGTALPLTPPPSE